MSATKDSSGKAARRRWRGILTKITAMKRIVSPLTFLLFATVRFSFEPQQVPSSDDRWFPNIQVSDLIVWSGHCRQSEASVRGERCVNEQTQGLAPRSKVHCAKLPLQFVVPVISRVVCDAAFGVC